MQLTWTQAAKAHAYELVANWHDEQGRGFAKMAEDEPRIDAATRDRARAASVHHFGSAAALRNKAYDTRRRALATQPKDRSLAPGPFSF